MGSWSKKEDKLLLKWAAKYGPSGWSYLLPKLNLKSVDACSSRFYEISESSGPNRELTIDELSVLYYAVIACKGNWDSIEVSIDGFSTDALQLRWISLCCRLCHRFKVFGGRSLLKEELANIKIFKSFNKLYASKCKDLSIDCDLWSSDGKVPNPSDLSFSDTNSSTPSRDSIRLDTMSSDRQNDTVYMLTVREYHRLQQHMKKRFNSVVSNSVSSPKPSSHPHSAVSTSIDVSSVSTNSASVSDQCVPPEPIRTSCSEKGTTTLPSNVIPETKPTCSTESHLRPYSVISVPLMGMPNGFTPFCFPSFSTPNSAGQEPKWGFVPLLLMEVSSDSLPCKRPGATEAQEPKRQVITPVESLVLPVIDPSSVKPSIATLLDVLRREANSPAPTEEIVYTPTNVVPTFNFCNQTISIYGKL